MDVKPKKKKEQGKLASIAFPDFNDQEIEEANAFLKKKKFPQEELQRLSDDRFNVVLNTLLPVERTDHTEWCICENCANDPLVKQNVCCGEVALSCNLPEDKKKLIKINERYKEKFRACGNICITKHASFDAVMLNEEVLGVWIEVARGDKKKRRVIEEHLENDKNRVFRHYSYRSFIQWAYGHLSRGERYEIPACVRNKIISAFPSLGYTGFQISDLLLTEENVY